jgi:hypothetical protein
VVTTLPLTNLWWGWKYSSDSSKWGEYSDFILYVLVQQ